MSGSETGSETRSDTGFDFSQLLAEIDREVARRRASGDLPPDFERHLDQAFASLAPVDAVDSDFDTLLARIDASAAIDTRPSTLSARPGVARIKEGVARATAFSMRHVATQVSSLVQALARALRLLSERVDRLEQESPQRRSDVWLDVQRHAMAVASLPPGNWDEVVLDALRGTRGRVLHAEAGDGELVGRLVDAGFEAYGIEPLEDAAWSSSERAPDIRVDDVATHLRMLPPQSLGGLVLSRCVERLPAIGLVELVELAASRLIPGTPLVVISTHPTAWARGVSPVAADLAPGRPLYPETWRAVLDSAGFSGTDRRLNGDEAYAVTARSPH